MLAWLILTGVLCLLLGIALTLAVQRALFLPAVDDKLLMTPVESVTAAPIQTERPVNPLGLPQVIKNKKKRKVSLSLSFTCYMMYLLPDYLGCCINSSSS